MVQAATSPHLPAMTYEQILSLTVLAGALVLFIWDRIRYDLVSLAALLAAVMIGVVPADKAFSGFSDQIVVVVASALVVSRALSKGGHAERLLQRLGPWLTTCTRQVAVLVLMVTVLSAFMKNIGALAMFIPVALQAARRIGASPSALLMPMAFGSLLGGVMTLIGTSPNIIVSRMRMELTGRAFSMFDFLPVGAAVAAVGVLYLVIAWRLLPERRASAGQPGERSPVQDYMVELRFAPESKLVGGTVGDLERLGGGNLTVATLLRGKDQTYVPSEHWRLLADDILVVETDRQTLQTVLAAGLELAAKPEGGPEPWEDIALLDAVIAPRSPLLGRSAADIRLRSRYGVNLLAVGRAGRQYVTHIRQMLLQGGDVIVLQGPRHTLPDAVSALGCIPLAYPVAPMEPARRRDFSLAILAAAILLMSLELVPVSVGFFGAAVALILTRHLSLHEAYEAVDVPIVVLLACLIPISDAIHATGATDVMAGALSGAALHLPREAIVVLMLATAMALTPVLNNAATVLVMAPIAVSLAHRLGLPADPLLMAVAIGAACDFLTPIGHQCNTLVMGPGGYKFADYWRLGLPLSLIVLVVGSGAILVIWPVR